MPEKADTGFKYISLLPRDLVFRYKGSIFCCCPLFKNLKPVGTRLRYVTNVFHQNFSKGILKNNFIWISVSNLIVLKFPLNVLLQQPLNKTF